MVASFVKIAVVSCVFGILACAAPTHPEYHHQYEEPPKENKHIPIVKQSFEQHHGAYQHSFESANGIHVQEQGYFKEGADKKHDTLVQQGSITYHDEHGNPITLTYIADENGFQPQGNHLPTPPPIPTEIAKSLEHHQQIHQQQQTHQHQQTHQQYQHQEPAHEEPAHHYEPQYEQHYYKEQ